MSLDPSSESLRVFGEEVARRVADRQRLAAVAATGLLDTPAESGFDRIALLASELLKTPFGFITVVDESRSFWKACAGIESSDPADRQNPVRESFCQYVLGLDDALVVDDTRLDDRTKGNPSIQSMGVLAWAGVPLRAPSGEVLGTVCVVDTKTRSWSERDVELLYRLADIAADEIGSRQHALAAERSEALLSAIVHRSPTGFCLVDEQLRYQMVNQALADINGPPIEAHLGHTIAEVLPDVGSVAMPLFKSVLDTGEAIIDAEVVGEVPARPGEQRTWFVSCFRIDAAGEDPVGVAALVTDVTDRVRSRRRASILAELTHQLAGLDDPDDIVAAVTAEGSRYLEAEFVGILLTDAEGGDGLHVLVSEPPTGVEMDSTEPRVSDVAPYGEAIRSAEPILVSTPADRRARYPGTVSVAEAVGIGSSASMPLLAGHRTLGVLLVGWRRETEPGGFPIAQLSVLADIVAQTLERARNNAERREVVRSLQTTLLSPPPKLKSIEAAVRYVSASEAIGFGGDWYELVPVGDDRVAVIVGDISGHDASAAAQMSQTRSTVSALVQTGVPLDELYSTAERVMTNHERRIHATVSVTIVDTAARTLSTVVAGHPPPILVSPSGRGRTVTHARRSLLGVPAPTPSLTTEPYEPGATLIAYTDGLIERRGSDIATDIDELCGFADQLALLSAEAAADEILDRYTQPAGQPDDIALIVARLA